MEKVLSKHQLLLHYEREDSPVAGVDLLTITYRSQGLQVKALLALPQGEGRFPALLYCRGGMKQIGKVKKDRIAQLASFGYVVLAPHYRGNEGGEGKDEFGGNDRYDVYAAYELLRGIDVVQQDRITLYGFSRGAIMALLAAIERKGFHSIVIWSGVVDLLRTFEERADMRKMLRRVVGHPEKNKEAYWQRSPIHRVKEITCPVLIIHGTADLNVGVEHALDLARELELHSKPHELWLAQGASHLFDSKQIEEYTRAMFEWLEKPDRLLGK